MRYEDKERLNQQTQKKYLWLRLVNGCKSLVQKKERIFVLWFFYPLSILIWYMFKSNLGLEDIPLISPVFIVLVSHILIPPYLKSISSTVPSAW